MPVEASALTLKYELHGQWYEASFAAKEQDSLTGGGATGLDYYLLNSSTTQADSIKEAIIGASLHYRVISPFTSFQGSIAVEYGGGRNDYSGTGMVSSIEDLEFDQAEGMQNQVLMVARNYPNLLPGFGRH